MGKIKDTEKYPYDNDISGSESLIGSDFDEQGRTRNYNIASLAAYFTQYFTSQDQTVSLIGEMTGGNGVTQISVNAQPAIISNRPTTTDLFPDNTFLYLNNGVLSKIRWQTISDYIIENSGSSPIIELDGDIGGTYASNEIITTAKNNIIISKPETTDLDLNSYFLFYDNLTSNLSKVKWQTISNYIIENVSGVFPTVSVDTYLGDTRVLFTGNNESQNFRITGTTNQVTVAQDAIPNRIKIGLPNSITLSNINVTTLTINGVPYAPYVHPTQAAISVSGSGLQFIQAGSVNTLGHTTSLSLGTIPSATTANVGVMRFATDSEVLAGITGVAVQPSQLTGSGSITGLVGYVPVFTSTNSIGNSVIRQNGSNIGIGILPSSSAEKLQVNGLVKADGYRTVDDDPTLLLVSDGTTVKPEADVAIIGGRLLLTPLNLTTSVDYTIPSNKHALLYLTYDGLGPNVITLPVSGYVGQRIYVMNVNDLGTTSTIVGSLTTIEIEKHTTCVFYYNGTNWIMTGKTSLTIMG